MTNFKCMNEYYRKVSMMQGPWNIAKWPLHAYSGSTGGHPGYGWLHDHMLSQEWVNWVIQCFAARPLFYNNSLYRQSGYLNGSRPQTYDPKTNKPILWTPADDGNLEGDQPNGVWKAPDGTEVSGPDLVHCPLSALFSVARSKGYTANTPEGVVPAEELAKKLLKYIIHAFAGFIRDPKGFKPYVGSDRQQHYVFHNLIEGLKLGVIESIDADLFVKYIVGSVLPTWFKTPYGSDTRVYNGLHWILPALWDAYTFAPKPAGELVWPSLVAKAKCCLQLAQLVPGKACTVNDVTEWGPNCAIKEMSDYMGPWGLRAHLVAGVILGDEGKACTEEGMNEFAKWNGKPEGPNKTDWKCWSVDPDGNYLWKA